MSGDGRARLSSTRGQKPAVERGGNTLPEGYGNEQAPTGPIEHDPTVRQTRIVLHLSSYRSTARRKCSERKGIIRTRTSLAGRHARQPAARQSRLTDSRDLGTLVKVEPARHGLKGVLAQYVVQPEHRRHLSYLASHGERCDRARATDAPRPRSRRSAS